MPSHITHSGLDAHAAHHEDLGRIWLIYRAGIPHGFARQIRYNDWMHWATLEAMRIGETRCYHHGPKLETIMDLIAQDQVVHIKFAKERPMNTEADKQTIKELCEGYLSGEFPDLRTVCECLVDIGRDNPELEEVAEASIRALSSPEHEAAA